MAPPSLSQRSSDFCFCLLSEAEPPSVLELESIPELEPVVEASLVIASMRSASEMSRSGNTRRTASIASTAANGFASLWHALRNTRIAARTSTGM